MSLNRSEQIIFDYWQDSPDERHFWEDKVRATAAECIDDYDAAQRLDRDLWAYYQERSAVLPHFRDSEPTHQTRAPHSAAAPSTSRTSMRNLAELLLRLWAPPRPKTKRRED